MPNKNMRMKNKMVYHGHEHDDRVPHSSDSKRRVSFKHYGSNRHKNMHQRARDEKMQAALGLYEDDEVMLVGQRLITPQQPYFNHNRYRSGSFQRNMSLGRGPKLRGRGGLRQDLANLPGRRLQPSPVHWYKVTIPEGHKYEKEYILGLIESYVKPLTFTAYGYKKQAECTYFYVDDYDVAQQILSASRKITTADNFRIVFIVRGHMPQVDVDEGMRALIKLAMSSRYNVVNKALDLTKFHADPVITKENVFCPLSRVNVMMTVIQIIADSIPDLQALNLSDNKLVIISSLKMLKTVTPNLKVLHIGKNDIRSLDLFDPLQGLQIEELELDGNPLCDKFRDKDSYIREVQKRFNKVIKLDGTDVPRMITFAVEEETTIVPSQGSFLCDPAAAEVIRPFLQQYYNLYDSDSRAPLLDAYHEDAQFSLSISLQSTASSSMTPYIADNRNLLVVNNPERRKRLLKRGKANILSFLTSLPKTQHDPASLTVDCSIFSPTIIMLSVTGVFREVGGDKKYPMRSFHRSFIIVPVGTGFCIINELLHISAATSDQVKAAFSTVEAATPGPSTVAPPAPAVVPPVVAPGPIDVATQQQMVTTLAMQSGMNLTWSEKCLSENGWDFNRAAFIFSELQKQGKIPAEAFIK